jgi:hypothetical protein
MTLSKKERAELKKMFGDRCAYCGNVLGDRWHADHVEAVIRRTERVRDENGQTIVKDGRPVVKLVGFYRPENDRKDGFYPACVACNIDKACEDLEMWRKHLADKIHIALRGSTPLRHALRFGMVQIVEQPIVFWFEKYQAEAVREEGEGK